MVFSFSTAPLAKPKMKPKRRRKARVANTAVKVVRKIKKSVHHHPATKAEVVKLMAMIIDPIADILDEKETVRRKRLRLRKALECLELYDHFLNTDPPRTTRVILRRGRKPLFRS